MELEDLKCKICRVKSSNLHYSHYGGKGCCFSCKAFFRRAVLTKNKLRCKSRLNICNLESQLPYPCRSCRFNACIRIGMDPIKVPKMAEDPPKELDLVFTFNEMSLLFQACHDWINVVKDYCKCEWYDLGHDLAMVFTKRHKVPWHCKTFSLELTNVFTKTVTVDRIQPDLNDHEGSKKCLARNLEAAGKFVFLGSLGLDLTYPNRFQRGIFSLDSIWWNEESRMNLKKMVYSALNHHDCEDLPDILPFDYGMVYSSPWLASFEDEMRHKEIAKKLSLWPLEETKSNGDEDVVKADVLLHHLMLHMIVFSTEDFENEVSKTMRNLQAEYLTKFQRYLKAKYPKNYQAKISEGFEIMKLSMEAADLESKMLPL